MTFTRKFLISLVLLVTVGYFGLVWFVNREVARGIDQAVADTPGMTLSYTDLDVSLSDHSVTLSNADAILPDGTHFTAQTLRITRFDQNNPVPHFIAAEASGVIMASTPANFGPLASRLMDMGKEVVTGNMAFEYDYSPQNQALNLKTLDIKADDLFDARLTGTIDRLDLAELRMEKLIGLRIAEADLVFTNRSLVNGLLTRAAGMLGMSVDDARKQAVAEITTMADYAARGGNRVAEDALRGFKRFVDNPGTIEVSARPKQPVPYLYFFMGRDLYDNIRLLNVSVHTDSGEEI